MQLWVNYIDALSDTFTTSNTKAPNLMAKREANPATQDLATGNEGIKQFYPSKTSAAVLSCTPNAFISAWNCSAALSKPGTADAPSVSNTI